MLQGWQLKINTPYKIKLKFEELDSYQELYLLIN